nr:maleylpyruvate isomerase N-terminal domain-containing protein [Mycolicibacterium hippocampi]
MSVATAERAALLLTLTESDPDSPTLCAGWTTRDPLVHPLISCTDGAGGIPDRRQWEFGRATGSSAPGDSLPGLQYERLSQACECVME